MLAAEYGLGKPTRMSYGEDDLGPRAVFDATSGQLVPFYRWIITNPNGTQVPHILYINLFEQREGSRQRRIHSDHIVAVEH